MSIIKVTLRSLPLRSKPRGHYTKTGKIQPSRWGYDKWKKQAIATLLDLNFKIDPSFYALIFGFYIKPKGGKQPDSADNLKGSLLDVFVSGGFILDDNWRIVSNSSDFAREDRKNPRIEIFCCDTASEYLQILNKIHLT